MPKLTNSEIQQMMILPCDEFVETGTYLGETTEVAAQLFSRVTSIELSPALAEAAAKRLSVYPQVQIIEGDSAAHLPRICRELGRPTFFWLDGHWSCGITARGSVDVPLLAEINAIVQGCAPSCIIVVDDARLFGTTVDCDWSLITRETVIAAAAPRAVSVSYFPSELDPQDRMVIQLRPLLEK
ncbi:MAG: hypothetical protein EBU46_10505 [Nitrosomonadaceae bacterium]|nr:hypothetical protein [Nitrosomonadaceae bacterium]